MTTGEPGARPLASERFGRMRSAFRVEDLLLLGWGAVGWPLTAVLFGSVDLGSIFDVGHPVRGLLWVGATVGALVVLGSRNADEPPDRTEEALGRRLATFGPLVGGMSLVAAGGFAALGLPEDPAMGLVFVVSIVLIVAAGLGRQKPLPRATRRALVTPFILVAAGLFNGTMASIAPGPANVGDALGGGLIEAGENAVLVGLGLVVGLFVLIAAPFYAMLVFAPRRLAEPEGSPLAWLLRFALFTFGSLLGISWLAASGG
ncbi:MAG TPA: hypothetical protein VFO78_11560 [Candidatus Limnocylindrales bacterium]|nr:hypothetical protein [Candidatus Limnocylindrales bacterium]